jgi:type I restriction enzyme, S subunit
MAGRYQAYYKYKYSGVEWLGDVPTTWSTSFVKHCLVSSPCYGILKPDKYDGKDGVKVIRILDVSDRKVKLNQLEIVSPELSREYNRTLIKKGDLIVSVVGTLGRNFICADEHEGLNLSRALARLQVKSSSKTRYLQYLIDSKCFTDYVNITCTGAAQKVFNMEDLSNWPIPFTEDLVLSQIANFLDYETAKIDALIEKQQQLIKLLKEKRQAVISHAVTKGLNPDAPMKDSGVEWLGDIPKHWVIMSLSKASKRITVGLATSVTDYYRDEGVAIIRNTNIKEGYFNGSEMLYLDKQFAVLEAAKVIYYGDVIVVRTGSNIGLACIVPEEYDQCHTFTTLIVTTQDGLLNRYLTYCINSAYGKAEVSRLKFGFGKDNLNVKEFKCFYMLLPSYEEQVNTVGFLDHLTAKIDVLIEKTLNSIDLIKERRTALISAAVTGKIDVRNWQPSEQNKTNKEGTL